MPKQQAVPELSSVMRAVEDIKQGGQSFAIKHVFKGTQTYELSPHIHFKL